MAQDVSRWRRISEILVGSQAVTCRICGEQGGTETGLVGPA